jgi:hypothetical protein
VEIIEFWAWFAAGCGTGYVLFKFIESLVRP